MKKPKLRKQKLWAIVKHGRLVVMDQDSKLGELLIFKQKWRAEGALWKAGEKIIPITVVYG